MDNRFVDTVLNANYATLLSLGPGAIAAYLAACATRLSRCIEAFPDLKRFDGIARASSKIDRVWSALIAEGQLLPTIPVSDTFEDVPHADDYPTFQVLAVHDFVIDADLAYSTLATGIPLTRPQLDYTLEVFLAKALSDVTGYTDLAGDEIDEAAALAVNEHPIVSKELGFQCADLSALRAGMDRTTLVDMRTRATANAWPPAIWKEETEMGVGEPEHGC